MPLLDIALITNQPLTLASFHLRQLMYDSIAAIVVSCFRKVTGGIVFEYEFCREIQVKEYYNPNQISPSQ